VSGPPQDVLRVLEEGTFCFVAAPTPRGPHVTPLVFATSSGRVWLTTSRRSVKARAWGREPVAAGLVRAGDRAALFSGRVRIHDALDPATWIPSVLHAPRLAAAAIRFSRKNARFFAGYAVDARRVPLAWTPPGRVFVELELRRTALLEGGAVVDLWGRWPRAAASRPAFRVGRGRDPLAGLPPEVAARVGREGEGALALVGAGGPLILPATWAAGEGGFEAALPEPVLSLAAAPAEGRGALAVDRASWWRAREMVGFTAQGRASVYLPAHLSSGAGSARARLEALGGGEGWALVRLVPDRVAWWRGWSSGTVDRARERARR
jgi:hypothetical protein